MTATQQPVQGRHLWTGRRPSAPTSTTRNVSAMSALERLLEESRPALEAGLHDAERELEELDKRRLELRALIARAKAALGELDVAVPDYEPAPLKLHEAMEQVLEEVGGEMRIQDLVKEINDRGLYTKADHSPVNANQIHARAAAKTYRDRFERHAGIIRLRASEPRKPETGPTRRAARSSR
jgi:chorismate mutase